MTAFHHHTPLKWIVVAVLATLVTWLVFRGYLSPDFLVSFSMYC
jgi:hypothetical protein